MELFRYGVYSGVTFISDDHIDLIIDSMKAISGLVKPYLA